MGVIVLEKKFNQSEYITKYIQAHYTEISLRFSKEDFQTMETFADNLQLSKSSLLQKCLVYCYENDIDLT